MNTSQKSKTDQDFHCHNCKTKLKTLAYDGFYFCIKCLHTGFHDYKSPDYEELKALEDWTAANIDYYEKEFIRKPQT